MHQRLVGEQRFETCFGAALFGPCDGVSGDDGVRRQSLCQRFSDAFLGGANIANNGICRHRFGHGSGGFAHRPHRDAQDHQIRRCNRFLDCVANRVDELPLIGGIANLGIGIEAGRCDIRRALANGQAD